MSLFCNGKQNILPKLFSMLFLAIVHIDIISHTSVRFCNFLIGKSGESLNELSPLFPISLK